MPTDLADDPADLVDALTDQFERAREALRAVGGIAQQLAQAARASAEAATPRLVRITAMPPPTSRRVQRRPGRPKGSRNNLCLLATPQQIEELRAKLARHPATPGR